MSKLTNEQRIEIYKQKLKGITTKTIALNFNINISRVKYIFRLIEKHGYDILRNNKNKYYSKEFKVQTINKILINKESLTSVAIDIGLSSEGILSNWVKNYRENCYNIIEKVKGRKKSMVKKIKKNDKAGLTPEEKIKELEKKNLYLEAENEYLKKLNALVQEKELQKEKKAE